MDEAVRILGVDDSLTIRKALELVLRPAGYNLELAASGAEAVEKAKGFRPAVMLLDFILPDMRGTEVCKRLAADPETAGIPVVLISAKGAEIRQAYQDVGNVVNYITKPFTPDDVTGVVSEVLAKAREGGLGITVEAPAPPAPEAPPPVGVPISPPVTAPFAPGAPPVQAPAATPVLPPTAAPAPEVVAPPSAPPAWAEAPRRVEEPAAPAEAWEEAEEGLEEEIQAPAAAAMAEGARREALEVMFETLRAGLEGVYVEEVDTPAGAAADEAKSYMDLVSQLTRQLGETLSQARSGLRFNLSSDGSLRSVGDALFDAHRRICRLLFRAVAAGAIDQETAAGHARVLVACRRDSELFDTLQLVARANADWHGLIIAERFRQLPIMTRLYGPSHLVVEAVRGGALLDQLKVIRAMPEARRLRLIGVVRKAEDLSAAERAALTEVGVDTVLEDGPDLLVALRDKLLPGCRPAGESATEATAAL